ncbi:hypothetical protein NPX13_g1542 [Xylaria arbuscula]|uniref:G domain-containing protein n=1 Tax=Xylaria arbuscula TaxID=114810 RepID=A0A9W8TPJ3_9PEZI|nr:hypothetical protein NPX13_g1542 [Xylaria arbuscula]
MEEEKDYMLLGHSSSNPDPDVKDQDLFMRGPSSSLDLDIMSYEYLFGPETSQEPTPNLDTTRTYQPNAAQNIDEQAMFSPDWDEERSGEDVTVKTEHELQSAHDIFTGDTYKPPRADLEAEAAPVNTFPCLQKAMDSEDAEVLCSHQSTGAAILEELAQKLSSNTNCIDHARMSSINDLRKTAQTPKMVIGVVGNTGHGKSSFINALLEEDKLVPTSCFRACTAVVTEVSWNPSNDANHQYTAEIGFISPDDWGRELRFLFHDVESSGVTANNAPPRDGDASIAWAKIKAVYPGLTWGTVQQTNPDVLVDDPTIKALLGMTKTICKRTANELFVVAGEEGEDHLRRIELWPLIKVVRVYTKADVLSTGAVIVDLPGVKDSNAARAAVAGKYIKKCNAIWIVSSITRAVDDQAAQELLGGAFKQQLQLDCNYSKLTFICSKTDDINSRKAAESFGLSDDTRLLEDAERTLSALESSSKLDELRQRKDAVLAFSEEVDDHVERYDQLRNKQAKGQPVNPPKNNPQKRNPQHTRTPRDRLNKRRRVEPEEAQDQRRTLQDKIDEDEDRLENLQIEIARLQELISSACISRRNEISRNVIRQQFVLGLKELDEHEAQRTDPDNFDPEQEKRDYSELERSLRVFCVSSQAYESLARGSAVLGFQDVNDTEIPQLRIYAKESTGPTRACKAKCFLNGLARTLNSLYLWSRDSNTDVYLTHEERMTTMGFLRDKVEQLGRPLQKANEDLFYQLKEILEVLFNRFNAAALYAYRSAPGIARGWPTPTWDGRCLNWSAYRATLRRNGVYSGSGGPRDFNEDLASPMLQNLGNHWEITFAKKIPDLLVSHTQVCKQHQEYIHSLIEAGLQSKAAFDGVVNMLRDQNEQRVIALSNKIDTFNSEVSKLQKEANRAFTPAIQENLKPKYQENAADRGPGVFARIRENMEQAVNKRKIFMSSCQPPQARLSELPKDIKHELDVYSKVMLDEMLADYKSIINGSDSPEKSKAIRQEIHELLKKVDSRF